MSRTDALCPIAHAACPARQRCMVQFIGSLTLEPAGYHGRAHLQRRLYLVPSMYNISMGNTRQIGTTDSFTSFRASPCIIQKILRIYPLNEIDN